jgi:aspartate/methionine/tyrosine aminotransferase
MFALVDISAFGCDGETFANQLLDATGVSVVPGFAFGETVANCVRIGFCQETDQLIEAAKRMKIFSDTYLPKQAPCRN